MAVDDLWFSTRRGPDGERQKHGDGPADERQREESSGGHDLDLRGSDRSRAIGIGGAQGVRRATTAGRRSDAGGRQPS